ncbi:glutamate--cysteine ligase [Cupriavidus basilensis]
MVKEGLEVSEVIVQERRAHFEKINPAVAEPVVYRMVDRYVVGGFYRVHTGRGVDENLQRAGHATFRAAAVCVEFAAGQPCKARAGEPNRFYM